MLSLFLASMESTVVSTAAPTIVSQLGGLDRYSWIFAAYMLTSTVTVPIFGKLSDLYGRRPIYASAMAIFLIGSVLCGQARSMDQLIVFRAVQGLGAGGLLPLAFIIIGDIFSFEQRARMQGLFSGVWGVSSIVGPLLGGFIVDQVSWPWVFYLNIVPGLVALTLVWTAWKDKVRDTSAPKPHVDYAGSALLMAAVVALLIGLMDLQSPTGWVLIGVTIALAGALFWIERRSPDPVLPLPLFRERLFAAASAHGILAGWAMFGGVSFVPLFVQAVLGTSATAAGATLTPMLLSWVVASIIGSRLLLNVGYRTLALIGMTLLVIGSFLMTRLGIGSSQLVIGLALGTMGVGMGLSIPAFLIAVQSSVPRSQLGTATSTIQFTRSMGGTLGVSVMGVVLSMRLNGALQAAGIDPASISIDELLDPVAHPAASGALDDTLRFALANAIQGVFFIAFVGAVLGLVATALAPGGRIAQLGKQRATAEEEVGAQPIIEHS